MDASVLIVGAGPSGLVLALSLLQNGVSVRIIDKEPFHRVGERGAGMMPRTLELHNLLGTLPDIQKIAGVIPKRRAYELPGGTRPMKEHALVVNFEPTPDIPYPNSCLIGQNHQEAILRSHIKKYGVEVELGTALEKFEQYEDHVTAHLVKTVDGKEFHETANFSYLAGTDGAHSIVRKQLGLTFLGETMEGMSMKIGDIVVKEGLTNDAWHFWGDFNSKMVSLRPSGQDHGIYSFIISGVDLSRVTASSGREDFIRIVEEVTGRKDFVFGDIVWINNYRPNIRMTNKFHVGRVFIAGDAAHCHSPTGGQGMNSSSQDSFNLGWKLALVIKGLAPPAILDTYDAERLPVISEMLQKTTTLLKRTLRPQDEKDEELAWARDGELRMLGVNYRMSPIVIDDDLLDSTPASVYGVNSATAARAGDRAPDAPELRQVSLSKEMNSLFRLFGSSYHTALVFGGSAAQHRVFFEAMKKIPSDLVKTVLISLEDLQDVPKGFDTVVVDKKGYAFKGYHIKDEEFKIVVVRPDGVVGVRTGSVDNFDKYFSRILL